MSMSNPEHHTITMSNTKRAAEEQKLQREWKDLENEKKKYLQRKVEEQEAKKLLRNWDNPDDDDVGPPF
jgi:hypothetical protein